MNKMVLAGMSTLYRPIAHQSVLTATIDQLTTVSFFPTRN